MLQSDGGDVEDRTQEDQTTTHEDVRCSVNILLH